MTLTPVYASPGVQLTNSPYASGKQWGIGAGRTAMGRYSTANNVEFIAGFPQKVAGFTALFSTGMTGVPRAIKTWRDANGVIRLAIGTDSHLYTCLADGTSLTDITPYNMVYRQTTTSDSVSLFQMGYSTTAGSAVMTMSFTFLTGGTPQTLATAAMANGDYIGFNIDTTIGGQVSMPFNGVYAVSNVTTGATPTFDVTWSAATTLTRSGTANVNIVFYKTRLAASPFATVSGSKTVTVTVPYAYTQGWDSNNVPTTCGQYVTFSGASTFNGVTISGEYLITPIGSNQLSYTIQSAVAANATSSGGGSSVVSTYTPAMNQYFVNSQPSTALSFTQRALPTSRAWSALCYGYNGFVALSTTTNGAISTDGITWTDTVLPSSQTWSAVCYGTPPFGTALYVALSASSVTAYSSDGTNWTAGALPAVGTLITPGVGSFTSGGVVYTITGGGAAQGNGVNLPGGSGTIAGELYNNIVYFEDVNRWYTWNGSYFSSITGSPPSVVSTTIVCSGIAFGAGLWVGIASSVSAAATNIAVSSSDAINWTQRSMPSAATWTCIAYGNSIFVALAGGSVNSTVAASSTNGTTWTARTLPTSAKWQSVAWGNNTFCAVAGGTATTVAATSPDGINWTARTLPSSSNWTGITYGQGYFVAVAGGSSNTVVGLSVDGITWTSGTMPATAAWTYVASGNARVVALAASSTVAATSANIVVSAAPSTLPIGWNLAAYGGLMMASPIGGTIYKYDPVAGGRAVTLAGAPGHCNGMFVTPERIIVALGATRGAVTDTPQIIEYVTFAGSNMTLTWCDQSDPTVWISATSNTAQSGRTLQGGDYFVGGIAVKDGTSLIFSNRCCFAMSYTGNYLIYDTPLLGDNAGLVSPYAVAAEGGTALWMNDCDLFSWSGSIAALPTDDVRSYVFANLNPNYLYKAVAGYNRLKKQVKFWYPSTLNSSENDACLIFQTDSLVFSTSSIARTGWTDSTLGSSPYGVDSSGNLYKEETGVDANGQPLVATLTFSPTDISNGDRSVDMFGFIPDFQRQTGNISLSINTQYFNQDPVTSTGPFTITTDDSNPELDLRCDGKLIGWTITSNVVGGDFRIGLCRVNFQPAGARD